MERNRVVYASVVSIVALIFALVAAYWKSGITRVFVLKPYYQAKSTLRELYNFDLQGRRSTSLSMNNSSYAYYGNLSYDKINGKTRPGDCLVNILIYKNGWSLLGRKPGIYSCKDLSCSFKLSYRDTPNSLKMKDIVLLYLRSKWKWDELLKVRPAGQIWIFYSRESPLHDHGIVPPSHLLHKTYNWTMTYRHDATISAPYGSYIPGEPEIPENDTRNWAVQKNKLAAWMASNCQISGWQRLQFMNKLNRKYLNVDMYGDCGTLKCPKDERCKQILSHYKFYFALENSLCKEYVTEKFWRNALQYGSVPIVYGASKADYEQMAPPHSFIHLDDFKSPEEFVKYLETVDNNDTLYNEYFEWKKKGRIMVHPLGSTFVRKTFCEMVQKYLEMKRGGGDKTSLEMPPLKSWWKDSCNQKRFCPVVKKVLDG